MDIGPLLIEQRRIADEYRRAEKTLQALRQQVLSDDNTPTDRHGLEAVVASRTAELERLGQRMLELDVSVTAAAFRSR
jgi:hypothetical protein